jgi:hypothetical protein
VQVVATDPASARPDCDNGTVLHHSTQRRKGHEHAATHVEAYVAEKYRPDLTPVAHQREARGGTTKERAARV